jgi:LPXTG-site transpeptidase (sortase) family protein
VLGGHSELATGQPDVFRNLDQVTVGDEIIITANGAVLQYTVSEVYRVNQYDTTPLHPTHHERLTLITCDIGSYDARTGSYSDRVVVVALPSSQ